jgi:hypothetical protein
MAIAASSVPQLPLAILAYGSLLHRPGAGLRAVIVASRPCTTPFPVEYGRASQRWGGGPVLVPHPAGAPVAGALLLLADGIDLGTAVDLLASREGLDRARGIVHVDLPGDRVVIAASLPRNLPAPDMTADALARRAIESAGNGPRNGVAYLRGAIASGIRTPLTDGYAERVLARVGAPTLEDAERLLAFPRRAGRRANGMG